MTERLFHLGAIVVTIVGCAVCQGENEFYSPWWWFWWALSVWNGCTLGLWVALIWIDWGRMYPYGFYFAARESFERGD